MFFTQQTASKVNQTALKNKLLPFTSTVADLFVLYLNWHIVV
jgi:hypothetical protein